jgi:hypothetical protein
MTSTLQVQTLHGPTSGADSNVIRIADGHNLHAKGNVVQCVYHEWNDNTITTAIAHSPANGSKISFTPKFANSLLVIIYDFSFSIEYISKPLQTGGSCLIFHDGTSIQDRKVVNESDGMPGDEFYSDALASTPNQTAYAARTSTRVTKINSVAAGSTSARDIELYIASFRSGNYKAVVNRGGDGNRSNLLVQEIAQ